MPAFRKVQLYPTLQSVGVSHIFRSTEQSDLKPQFLFFIWIDVILLKLIYATGSLLRLQAIALIHFSFNEYNVL